MKTLENIKIEVATEEHIKYIDDINDAIDIASKQRGRNACIADSSAGLRRTQGRRPFCR